MAQAQTELEVMEGVLDEYATIVAELTREKRELERALYAALNGVEVVIEADAPRALEWKTLECGRRMVRRARQ